MISEELPQTIGPCPHCEKVITSLALGEASFVADAQPDEAVPVVAASVRPIIQAPVATPAPATGVVQPAPGRRLSAAADRRSTANARRLVPLVLSALVFAAAAAVAIFYMTRPPSTATIKSLAPGLADNLARAGYLRGGWETEARTVLGGFLAAKTAAEKLPYILNGPMLEEALADFYGGTRIDDSDTPADSFTVYELSMEDRERGIFLMDYYRPPQFDLKEFFRPLAPAEVQIGLEEPGMLLAHTGSARNFIADPLRVRAFLKSTPQGLKLDWQVFAQTKYRTFQNFVELPGGGERGVFRVFIVEDFPEQGRDVAGFRTYRVADPAYTTDSARIRVQVDSDVGKKLSVINWRGIQDAKPSAPTATVELAWTGGASVPFELAIQRFICWEFLGLGDRGDPIGSTSH